MDLKEEIIKHTTEVKNLPMWIQYVVAGATIFGTVFGGWGLYVVINQKSTVVVPTAVLISGGSGVPTSTPNLSDILSKARSLETDIERQDFLERYVGSTVVAQGGVSEVKRSGTSEFFGTSEFSVDVEVLGQTIACPQEASEENERRLLLLKGKEVQITGKFPSTKMWGIGFIRIDECVLTRL